MTPGTKCGGGISPRTLDSGEKGDPSLRQDDIRRPFICIGEPKTQVARRMTNAFWYAPWIDGGIKPPLPQFDRVYGEAELSRAGARRKHDSLHSAAVDSGEARQRESDLLPLLAGDKVLDGGVGAVALLLPFLDRTKPFNAHRWISGLACVFLGYMAVMTVYGWVAK